MRSAPFLLALVLCGCARTRSLGPAEARAEVNRRAEGRTVSVVLRSGERVDARALRVDADSATWLRPGDLRLQRVAASDVVAVTHHDVKRGAADGFWIGLATGLVSSAVVFLAPVGGSQGWDPWVNGVLVASGGLAGAGWGTLGGTLATAPVTYRLGGEIPSPGESRGR
jgi:hypothetical protein